MVGDGKHGEVIKVTHAVVTPNSSLRQLHTQADILQKNLSLLPSSLIPSFLRQVVFV